MGIIAFKKKKKQQADVSHGWYPASFKLSDIARVFKTFCLNYKNYVSNNKNERIVTVAWKYSIFNIIYNWAEIMFVLLQIITDKCRTKILYILRRI